MPKSLFDLSGRVAIVTGGNGGIGLAMAEALAAHGARIAIAARDAAKAGDALAHLRTQGAECCFVPVDVASRAACDAMVGCVVQQLGRVDILINNAGLAAPGRAEHVPEADWHRVIDVNLGGAFFCAQAVHGTMLAQGGGKIINIGSIYSVLGSAPSAAYAASKGGLIQLTRSLAAAWARNNIQVNAVLPGWVETDLSAPLHQSAQASERIVGRTPARRWGRPEDMGGVAVFLASAASDFVTGASIAVDGGYLAQG